MGRSEDRSRTAASGKSSGAKALATAVCAAASAVFIAGCGEARQNAGEPHRSFRVVVSQAAFSPHEAVARPATLTIDVHNSGKKTMPRVAVTVDSLSYKSKYPGLSDRERPTWVIDTGPGPIAKPPVESEEVNPPGGAQTAFVHTWALGRLAPGESHVFRWKLTPVRPGAHTVHYSVAAGLYGGAKAVSKRGRMIAGTLKVDVAGHPPNTHVNPETGAIEEGAYRVASGAVGAVP